MSADRRLTVTYVRTCTLIIRMAGKTIVTDPWFSMRMRFLPALRRPGVPLSAVPAPDLVLLSHLHADHFDRRALQSLAGPQTLVVGPQTTACHISRTTSGNIEEAASGQTIESHGLCIAAHQVDHTYPGPDELGYAVTGGGFTFFFGGDAAFGPQFERIGQTTPIDVALLPVGGSRIFGKQTVMDPVQAVTAAEQLKAALLIPTHPGGDWLALPPASRHPGRATQARDHAARTGSPVEVVCLNPGQTVVIEKDQAGNLHSQVLVAV